MKYDGTVLNTVEDMIIKADSLISNAMEKNNSAYNGLYSKNKGSINQIKFPGLEMTISKARNVINEVIESEQAIIAIVGNIQELETATLDPCYFLSNKMIDADEATESFIPSDASISLEYKNLLSEFERLFLNDSVSDTEIIGLAVSSFIALYQNVGEEEATILLNATLKIKKDGVLELHQTDGESYAYTSFTESDSYFGYNTIDISSDVLSTDIFLHELSHVLYYCYLGYSPSEYLELMGDYPSVDYEEILKSMRENFQENGGDVILENLMNMTREEMGAWVSEQYYNELYELYGITKKEAIAICKAYFDELMKLEITNLQESMNNTSGNNELSALVSELSKYGLTMDEIEEYLLEMKSGDDTKISTILYNEAKQKFGKIISRYLRDNKEYGNSNIFAFSDIADAIYLGEHDMNTIWSHGSEYYENNINASFYEQQANYFTIRMSGNKEDLKLAETLYGTDWVNTMENIYENILSFNRD